MELTQLRYFAAVAKCGTMSRAAAELFVSQPNLSTSLTRLETELGVPLFDRRRGKIVLNEYGEAFLAQVEQALNTLDAGVRAVRGAYQDTLRPLSIACMVDDSRLLSAFVAAHPEISFSHRRADLDTISALLSREEVDLALTVLQPQGSQLEFERLYSCRFVLVLNRNDPLAGQAQASYSDMRGRRLIIDTSRVEPVRFLRSMREHGIQPEVDAFLQDSGVLLSLIEAGRCITHLPEVALKELLLENDYPSVTSISLPDDNPPAYWGIAWNKRRPLSAAGLCFREFARGYFPSVDVAFARRGVPADGSGPSI